MQCTVIATVAIGPYLCVMQVVRDLHFVIHSQFTVEYYAGDNETQ